jgi:hypothetical protein
MTSRRALLPFALLACAALLPTAALAQAASDSSCSYSRCALRVDYGFFSTRLKRGASDESVARLGPLGSGVGVLLAASDSAAHYARQYQRRRTTADVLSITSAALTLTALTTTDDFTEGGPLLIGGLALELIALPFHIGARRSLDRSVWWYNRDLPRP